MSMVRMQVFITAEQSRRLKQRARAAGVSQAELIRAGIDRELASGSGSDNWKERLLSVAGSIRDTTQLEQSIKEHRASWKHRLSQTRKKLAGEE